MPVQNTHRVETIPFGNVETHAIENFEFCLTLSNQSAKYLADFFCDVNVLCGHLAKDIEFNLPDNNLKVAIKALALSGDALERCIVSAQQMLDKLSKQPGLSPQQKNIISVTKSQIDHAWSVSQIPSDQLALQLKEAIQDIRFHMALSDDVQDDLAILSGASHSTKNEVVVFDSYRMAGRIDAIVNPNKCLPYKSACRNSTSGGGVVLVVNLNKWFKAPPKANPALIEGIRPDGLEPKEETQKVLSLEESLDEQYKQIDRIESELKRTFPQSAIWVNFFSRKFFTPDGKETTGLEEAKEFVRANTAILNRNLSANFIPANSNNLNQYTKTHGVSYIKYEPYWELPFNDETEKGIFTLDNGTKVTAEMMKLTGVKIPYNETYGNKTVFVFSLPTRLNPDINSDGLIRRNTGEKGHCIIALLDPTLTASEMSEAGQNLFNNLRMYGLDSLGMKKGHADVAIPSYDMLGACWFKGMLGLTEAKSHQKGSGFYTTTERPEPLYGARPIRPSYTAKLSADSAFVEIMVSEDGTQAYTYKLVFDPESKSSDQIREQVRDMSLRNLLDSPPPGRLADIIQNRDLKTIDLMLLRSVENLIEDHVRADVFSRYLAHAADSEHLYEKEFINFMLVCMLDDSEFRTRIVDYIQSAFIYYNDRNWGPNFKKILDGIANMMANTNKLKNYDSNYHIKALSVFLEKTPDELAEMGIKSSGSKESPENIINIFQKFCPGVFKKLNIPEISFSPPYSQPKSENIADIENDIPGLLKSRQEKELSFFVGYTERNDNTGKVLLVKAWLDESGKCKYELIGAPKGEIQLNQLPSAKDIWVYHPAKKIMKDSPLPILVLPNNLPRPIRVIDTKQSLLNTNKDEEVKKYEKLHKENPGISSLREISLHAKEKLWNKYGDQKGMTELFTIYDNLSYTADKKMMKEIFFHMLEDSKIRRDICNVVSRALVFDANDENINIINSNINNEINRGFILDEIRKNWMSMPQSSGFERSASLNSAVDISMYAKMKLLDIYDGSQEINESKGLKEIKGIKELFFIRDNLIYPEDKEMMKDIFLYMLNNPDKPDQLKKICGIALKAWNSRTFNNKGRVEISKEMWAALMDAKKALGVR